MAKKKSEQSKEKTKPKKLGRPKTKKPRVPKKKEMPFSKEEVETFVYDAMGSITTAASLADVPYSTFYSWMDKYEIKAYPDKVKRRVALMALDRARYLALTPQKDLLATFDKADPSLLKEILKKWGKHIEFEEPDQNLNVHHTMDPWDVILNEVDPQRDNDGESETGGS